MSKKCTNCGTVLDDDALFCTECGSKQEPAEKKCKNCGTVLPEGAKFCMNCGTPVDVSPATASAPKARPQVQSSPDFEVSQPDENTLTFNILGVPFNLKFIKGGMMGNIQISDFYLGETVVTQALWQTVTGGNPSEDNSDLQFPVTDFDGQQVKTFLTRLKKITGSSFEIPTGSQFKYAALKGCENMTESEFEELFWGDGECHPVCGMIPDRLGLFDVAEFPHLVQDCVPALEPCFRFNPSYEAGSFGADLDSPTKVDFSSPKRIEDSVRLRLVLNIPVDPEVVKAKRLQEKKALAEFEASVRRRICQNGKYGFADETGKVVIPCNYQDAGSFSEGLAWVKEHDKNAFVDENGRKLNATAVLKRSLVRTLRGGNVTDSFDGLTKVKTDGKYGYIDKAGRVVIPFKYDAAESFKGGFARVKRNGKIICIDKTGQEKPIGK